MMRYVCDECISSKGEYFETESDELIDGDLESCYFCDNELVGEVSVISSINVTDDLHNLIQDQIVGCFNPGCVGCGSWDSIDKEWIGRDLSGSIYDAFVNVWDVIENEDYKNLLSEADQDDFHFEVDFTCGHCGCQLNDWNDEVKIKSITYFIPHIPRLPQELRELTLTKAADQIEYFRSDCSNCLIHLTKPARVVEKVNNVDYEPQERGCTAAEVLYLILSAKKIRASKGPGMLSEAVCFTEKPLTALKEMLIGNEAKVRREKNGINWFPYGLMFEKEFAMEKYKVCPAIHLNDEEIDEIQTSSSNLSFRVVKRNKVLDFAHEREWRAASDVNFEPKDVVLIVPTWEQAIDFQKILSENQIQVKGFLPLLDVFKMI
ncbi:MAG: hypothetical protein KDD61_10145 [Bdellovibrionales bacterium]|nr:hypothetical protein [Bdellovibrionales bacterium]